MRNVIFLLILTVVAAMGLTTPAQAWDGERKGFIFGFGLGSGYINYKQEYSGQGISMTSEGEDKIPFVTDSKAGYAFTNQLALYWTGKTALFKMKNALDDDVLIAAGIGAISVSYFLQPKAPSVFFSGGLGYSSWSAPFEEESETWTGLGVTAGVGYEFHRYWNVEATFNYGNPAKDDFETKLTRINLTINVLGY